MFALNKAEATATATVSMPKAQQYQQPHEPYLVVIGGRLETSADPSPNDVPGLPFGIKVQALPLSGYALSLNDGAPSGALTFADTQPTKEKCKPDSAADWESMQYIVDVQKLYPHAKLKTGWNEKYAAATVTLTRGSLKALPAGRTFKGRWGWRQNKTGPVIYEQPMTGAAVWTFEAPQKIELRAAPLSEGSERTISIHRDTTGPLLTAILYVPTNRGSGKPSEHTHLMYTLFEGIPDKPEQQLYPEILATTECETEPEGAVKPGGLQLSPTSDEGSSRLVTLLQILLDGSPQCPPLTYRG
jgi:hypothetical protein